MINRSHEHHGVLDAIAASLMFASVYSRIEVAIWARIKKQVTDCGRDSCSKLYTYLTFAYRALISVNRSPCVERSDRTRRLTSATRQQRHVDAENLTHMPRRPRCKSKRQRFGLSALAAAVLDVGGR